MAQPVGSNTSGAAQMAKTFGFRHKRHGFRWRRELVNAAVVAAAVVLAVGFAWAVVHVFVEQLSVPPVVAQTIALQQTSTTTHTTTMTTLSEPQFLWAVVDVFVNQLSVPPVVAQTVDQQKHQ